MAFALDHKRYVEIARVNGNTVYSLSEHQIARFCAAIDRSAPDPEGCEHGAAARTVMTVFDEMLA